MKIMRLILIIVLMMVFSGVAVLAGSYRYVFISQSDWGAKRGFYLNLENDGPDGGMLKLNATKLILGVGDGKGWRYAITMPNWKTGIPYSLRAVIDGGRAEVWLNGISAVKVGANFVPNPAPGEVGGIPDWASAQTDFIVRQTSAEVFSGGKALYTHAMNPAPAGPLSLFGKAEPIGVVKDLDLPQGAPVEIRVEFVMEPIASAKEVSPLIDAYGQAVHGDWPGKVGSDGDLKASLAAEKARLREWGMPKNRDRFGGSTDLGWKVKGSGYYRLVMKNGMWWLVTPEGNPCFYTGICTAPSPTYPKTPVSGREYMFKELPPREIPELWGTDQWGEGQGTEYAGFIPWNLMRRFGDDWKRASQDLTGQRIKTWGFSGVGKWGGMEGIPNVPVLGRGDVPNLVGHPDIFDPEVKERFRESLSAQITPGKYDPMVVGWSLGNEYGEIITTEEIRGILAMEEPVPSKKALIEYALNNIHNGSIKDLQKAWGQTGKDQARMAMAKLTVPQKDIKELRRYYADAYYAFIYSTIKSLDPRHLYFGFWIVPGWWEEEEDWDIIARHCDVIGYDRYSPTFMDEGMKTRIARANKPVLLGEFSFPPTYGGDRGFGTYGLSAVRSEEDAGRMYGDLVAEAARNPMVVGSLWFEYRDEPITGRGPGTGDQATYGEHYAFGMVEGTDIPKWTLVDKVREANLTAPGIRGASRK